MAMVNTFGINIIPENEEGRLQKLHEYQVFNMDCEGPFKHIAALSAHIFKVPIALVSFVDSEMVWFKGNVGMEEMTRTDRGVGLCSLSIMSNETTVFKNTQKEPCLLNNPLVAGEFGLRFYAAAPITTYDGFNLGSVCVIDRAPRDFTEEDRITLQYMAKLVIDELELWKCKLYTERNRSWLIDNVEMGLN